MVTPITKKNDMDYFVDSQLAKEVSPVLSKVFGYIGIPFGIGKLEIPRPDVTVGKIGQAFFGDSSGNPPSPQAPNIARLMGKPMGMDLMIDGVTMPNAVVRFSQKSHIIKTSINGKKGTVKEEWGADDIVLKIAVVCVNARKSGADPNNRGGNYPEDQVKQVIDILKKGGTHTVVNKICAWLDVYKVVIDDWQIHDTKGKANIQVIEIDASSDYDYVAELTI